MLTRRDFPSSYHVNLVVLTFLLEVHFFHNFFLKIPLSLAWRCSSMRRPSADVEGRREKSVTIFNICSLMTSSLTLLNRTSESTTHFWSWWESFCLKQKSLIITRFSWADVSGQGEVWDREMSKMAMKTWHCKAYTTLIVAIWHQSQFPVCLRGIYHITQWLSQAHPLWTCFDLGQVTPHLSLISHPYQVKSGLGDLYCPL